MATFDLSTLFQSKSISNALTLETIDLIIRSMTGTSPTITTVNGISTVDFTPNQQVKLRQAFDDLLTGAGVGGSINVNAGPVVYPVVLKRLIPLLLICFALGYIVHR